MKIYIFLLKLVFRKISPYTEVVNASRNLNVTLVVIFLNDILNVNIEMQR